MSVDVYICAVYYDSKYVVLDQAAAAGIPSMALALLRTGMQCRSAEHFYKEACMPNHAKIKVLSVDVKPYTKSVLCSKLLLEPLSVLKTYCLQGGFGAGNDCKNGKCCLQVSSCNEVPSASAGRYAIAFQTKPKLGAEIEPFRTFGQECVQ